jgi:hypothetical protein
LGHLPQGCIAVSRALAAERRLIEREALETLGIITPGIERSIQTALRWSAVARLAQRWLRESYDKLAAAERLHFAREIAKASERRDNVLRGAGLGGGPRDDAAIPAELFAYQGDQETAADAAGGPPQ